MLLCIIMAFGTVINSKSFAQVAPAAGIVIYKSSDLDTPKDYNSSLFKTMRDAGAWMTFEIGAVRPLLVEKGFVVEIVDFGEAGKGNILTRNITTQTDADEITLFGEQLQKRASSISKLKPIADRVRQIIENEISLFRSGNIKKEGRWINKAEWERQKEELLQSAIVVAGKSFSNARFISVKNDVLTLSHDGGIAKIPLSSLSGVEKTSLSKVFKKDISTFASAIAPQASKIQPEPSSTVNAPMANPSAYLTQKMDATFFPTVSFENATFEEAIEYLRLKSKDLDPDEVDPSKKGVNIVINQGDVPAGTLISLDLKNVPMSEALRYICNLAKMKYTVEPFAVTIESVANEDSKIMKRAIGILPSLPNQIKEISKGDGDKELTAISDALVKALSGAIRKNIPNSSDVLSTQTAVDLIDKEAYFVAGDYRKIAIRRGGDKIRTIVEATIPREKLIQLLLKLGYVEK